MTERLVMKFFYQASMLIIIVVKATQH